LFHVWLKTKESFSDSSFELHARVVPDILNNISRAAVQAHPQSFEWYRFHFQFRAQDTVWFPPLQSANIVRGAFGSIFRRLVCMHDCTDTLTCERRATCAYAQVFEPRAARGEGPSGLRDWPRPFVFRAAHLDGHRIEPGQEFHFGVHLFETREPRVSDFIHAFAELARAGLGPGRGKAELVQVDQLDGGDSVVAGVFDRTAKSAGPLAPPNVSLLEATAFEVARTRVRFLSPTELKGGDGLAPRPEFAVLFARLRDRISSLRALYGSGPLEIDFRAMGERAAQVRLTRCDLSWVHASRDSSRTGQHHPIGGFVGEVEYEGPLGEFLPYLRLSKWVGVGRQTVWGKGELHLVEG
jgi:hypothetical protein